MKTRVNMGNEGRPCLVSPEHGPSFVLTSGREWCPHHDHDMPKAAPSMLDKQVIEDDQADQAQPA